VENLQNWASKILGGGNITHAYSFGDYRGFAGFLNQKELNLLREHPAVKLVDEDGVVRIPENETPGQPFVLNMTDNNPPTDLPGWGQYRSDQLGVSFIWDGSVPFTPSTEYHGEGTTAWVLDTGIQVDHQEFKGRAFWDVSFVGETSDGNGHGTHCAGTIVGTWAGYVPKAEVRSVQVLSAGGSGAWSGIVSGIQYVVSNRKAGFNVMSMSLGGGTNLAANEALDKAAQDGVPSMVAAGNSNADAINTSPCSALEAICVGATDINNNLASYSNFGSRLSVLAPGTNIKSSWIGASGQVYNTISGTSMATPAAAGAVMVLATKHKHYQTKEIKEAIREWGQKNIINLHARAINTNTPNTLSYDRWDLGN